MFTESLIVGDYDTKDYIVKINAAWVKILDRKTGAVITKREPQQDNWYDMKHKRVMQALYELQDAILDLAKD